MTHTLASVTTTEWDYWNDSITKWVETAQFWKRRSAVWATAGLPAEVARCRSLMRAAYMRANWSRNEALNYLPKPVPVPTPAPEQDFDPRELMFSPVFR